MGCAGAGPVRRGRPRLPSLMIKRRARICRVSNRVSGRGSTKIERLDRACGGKSTVLGSLGRRKVKWTAIYDWLGAAGVSRRLGARLGEGDRAVGAAGPADTSMQRARSFLQCGRRQSGDSEQGSVKGTGRLVRRARPFLPCSEQDQSSSAARRQSGDSEKGSVKGTGRSARRARPFLPCIEQVQSSSAARWQFRLLARRI